MCGVRKTCVVTCIYTERGTMPTKKTVSFARHGRMYDNSDEWHDENEWITEMSVQWF